MWFNKNTAVLIKELEVNPRIGLSENEVIQRREEYGLNVLVTKKWVFVLGLSFMPLVINELVKTIRRRLY